MAYRRIIEAAHGRPHRAGDPTNRGRQRLQAYERGEDKDRPPPPAALAVLAGLATTGLSPAAYARRCGRSHETVKSQLRTLRAYYGCSGKNTLYLYRAAVMAGHIALEEGAPAGVVAARLTPRQRQVLYLWGVHGSRTRVARSMGVTVHTVKWHLLHAAKALGCSNSTQAYARARQLHLL